MKSAGHNQFQIRSIRIIHFWIIVYLFQNYAVTLGKITQLSGNLCLTKYTSYYAELCGIVRRIFVTTLPMHWALLSTNYSCLFVLIITITKKMAHQVKSREQKEHFSFFPVSSRLLKLFIKVLNSSDSADIFFVFCIDYNDIFFVSKTY